MLILILVVLFIIWKIYESSYYKSDSFLSLKRRIQSYIDECNEFNMHICDLKQSHIGANRLDSGRSDYQDCSKWNFKRPKLKEQQYSQNVHNCSRTVCDNARKEPFKYVCKYFGIKADEQTLEEFEKLLNNFSAVEEGKFKLKAKKESIVGSIDKDIPPLIKLFGKKKIESKLGFSPVDLGTSYFPRYTFKYISAGGNASTQCDVVMDIDNLNRFVNYLSEKIKFRKSVAGQRALMTSALRDKIKARDGYRCRKCGASVSREPNLLLEIDHIIPLSRGGLTTESNLQTLCWKCNRSKGAKV